jgi:hypothetical protein
MDRAQGVVDGQRGWVHGGPARTSMREEREGATAEVHKPKEKACLPNAPRHLGPTWPSGGGGGLGKAGLVL